VEQDSDTNEIFVDKHVSGDYIEVKVRNYSPQHYRQTFGTYDPIALYVK
jgi:hypothetical protein